MFLAADSLPERAMRSVRTPHFLLLYNRKRQTPSLLTEMLEL